jgi:hypothetical protein
VNFLAVVLAVVNVALIVAALSIRVVTHGAGPIFARVKARAHV